MYEYIMEQIRSTKIQRVLKNIYLKRILDAFFLNILYYILEMQARQIF